MDRAGQLEKESHSHGGNMKGGSVWEAAARAAAASPFRICPHRLLRKSGRDGWVKKIILDVTKDPGVQMQTWTPHPIPNVA